MTNNAFETIKTYEELEEFNESKYINTVSKAIPKKGFVLHLGRMITQFIRN